MGIKQQLKTLLAYQREHEIVHRAAALSYYAIFALIPMLVFFFAGTRFLLANPNAAQSLFVTLETIVGTETVSFIEHAVSQTETLGDSTLLVVIGVVLLILTSLRLLSSTGKFLDELWATERTETFRRKFFDKLFSFSVLILTSVVFMVSIVFATILNNLSNHILALFNIPLGGIHIAGTVLLFLFINTLLSFRLLPQEPLPWRVLLGGSILTTTLIAIGQLAVALYFQYIGFGSIYGAAGSVFILLLWVFYSTFLYLTGASITYLRYKKRI